MLLSIPKLPPLEGLYHLPILIQIHKPVLRDNNSCPDYLPGQNKSFLYGYDYSKFFSNKESDQIKTINEGIKYLRKQKDGKNRFISRVTALENAYLLTGAHDEAIKIKDDISFFRIVKSNIVKDIVTEEEVKGGSEQINLAIQQLVTKATRPGGVIDLLTSNRVKSFDISILSEDFLSEICNMKNNNTAIEHFNKLIQNEIKIKLETDLDQSRTFTDMLEEAIKKYESRIVEAEQMLTEQIKLAREKRDAYERIEKLKLTNDKTPYYHCLVVKCDAVRMLGNEILQPLAQELERSIHKNFTNKWYEKEKDKTRMKLAIKETLKKYGYPLNKIEKATLNIFEQAKEITKHWKTFS
jgi:type I restriction enzyme R subunit